MNEITLTNKICLQDDENSLEFIKYDYCYILKIGWLGKYNGMTFSEFNIRELESLRDELNKAIIDLKGELSQKGSYNMDYTNQNKK